MLLKSVMRHEAHPVDPDMTLHQVAREMLRYQVSLLPVCQGSRVIGVVTDRDLVIRGLARSVECGSLAVRHVMSQPVHVCQEDRPVSDALTLMLERSIHHVPIVDADERLVGMISLNELVSQTSKPTTAA